MSRICHIYGVFMPQWGPQSPKVTPRPYYAICPIIARSMPKRPELLRAPLLARITPSGPWSPQRPFWPYLAQYRHFGLFLGPKLTRRRSPVFQGRTAPEPGSAPGCRWAAHRLYGALLAHFARCGAGLLPVILPHILQVSARSTNGKAPSALLRGGFRAAKC